VIAFLCTYLPPFKKRTNGLAVLPTWRNISRVDGKRQTSAVNKLPS
jgi:hypothetical protein